MTRYLTWGLVLLALAGGTASLPTHATENSMEEQCRREVLELHQFFQDWFNAELEPTDKSFARFADVMDEDFVIIGPGGGMTARGPLLEGLRGAHGRWKAGGGGRIWIENVRLHRQQGDWAMVTYEEWQEVDGQTGARRSSALFGRRDATPNGVVWLHLHEVRMPAEE